MNASRRLTGIPRLLIPALLLCSTSVGAQVIRGTVHAEGVRAPLRGAVVTLLDARGNPGDRRVLTDNDGAFAMRVPSAGSWMIEVRAIGYAPRRTAARSVASAETLV